MDLSVRQQSHCGARNPKRSFISLIFLAGETEWLISNDLFTDVGLVDGRSMHTAPMGSGVLQLCGDSLYCESTSGEG